MELLRDRLALDVARTPSIRQMEAVECGAAALAMVLAYHGAWIPLETLRVACGVSRDGSKASNILKAARSLGMNAKGFRKEPDGLRALPMPSIVHWNFNHYVVLEGFAAGYAYLNDPAGGRIRVTEAEFSDAFTGVVLAIEPAEQFRRTARPPGPAARLLRLLRGSRASVLLVALFSLMLVLPGLVIPGLSRLFIDKVLL